MLTVLREWRNWQTRTFEGRVVLPYGFNSRLPHQQKRNFCLPKVPFLLSKPQAWYGINAPRVLYGIATKSRMALREARIE